MLSFKNEKKVIRSQDEVILEGMATIESAVDLNCIHSFALKGLSRMDKDDDFSKVKLSAKILFLVTKVELQYYFI